MFDPVSLIVAALVRGLLLGVRDIAREAVVDGYQVLRQSLVQRYGAPVATSIGALERDPESERNRAEVAAALRRVGADQDPELTRLARQLNDLVDNPDRVVEAQPVDPVEQLKKFTGLRVIGDVLQNHVNRVLSVRSQYAIEDTDLLSSRLATHAPPPVRMTLDGLHERIRQVIVSVAQQIEDARYLEVEQAIGHLPTGLAERGRAARLVAAEKRLHVSYETLRLTVEFLGELNRSILSRIETETSPHQLSNMMFGNAVLIYELADFVIGYIEHFTLDNNLGELHSEAKKRLKGARDAQQALLHSLDSGDIDEAVRAHTLESIRNRDDAINELEREWDDYLGDVESMAAAVNEVRAKVPTLNVIRENARIQIVTMQLVALLSLLKQNAKSIRGAVETLEGFQLAPLTSTRVRRLLGM